MIKRRITKKWLGCQFEVGEVVEVDKLSPILKEHSEEVKEEKPKRTRKAKE